MKTKLTFILVIVLVSFLGGWATGKSKSPNVPKDAEILILDLRKAAAEGYMQGGLVTERGYPDRANALCVPAWEATLNGRAWWFNEESESSFYLYSGLLLQSLATDSIFMAVRTGRKGYLDDAEAYLSLAGLTASVGADKRQEEEKWRRRYGLEPRPPLSP